MKGEGAEPLTVDTGPEAGGREVSDGVEESTGLTAQEPIAGFLGESLTSVSPL